MRNLDSIESKEMNKVEFKNILNSEKKQIGQEGKEQENDLEKFRIYEKVDKKLKADQDFLQTLQNIILSGMEVNKVFNPCFDQPGKPLIPADIHKTAISRWKQLYSLINDGKKTARSSCAKSRKFSRTRK